MTFLATPVAFLAALHLFLIGDAGNPDPKGEPVLRALTAELHKSPENSAVIVLGDNIYPSGLPDESDEDHGEMARRIGDQVRAITEAGVRGMFIPGNHDWGGPGPQEWQRVVRQEALVERLGGPLVRWLPDGGCPGPVVVDDVDPGLRLVILDTQWWLHDDHRPDEESVCGAVTDTAIVSALTEALVTAGERKVIVVGHHPLASRGAHGGHFTVTDHLFPLRSVKSWLLLPLPAIGSLYPLSRAHGIYGQDLSAGVYQEMRRRLLEAFAARPPWMYVAGHDHNLQLLDGRAELGATAPTHLVVSGAGLDGHTEPVDTDRVRVASSKAGFIRIDLDDSGAASITLIGVSEEGRAVEIWTGALD